MEIWQCLENFSSPVPSGLLLCLVTERKRRPLVKKKGVFQTGPALALVSDLEEAGREEEADDGEHTLKEYL